MHHTMRNIVPVSRQWLADMDILTLNELRHAGAVAAYQHSLSRQPQATQNLLWSLLGAEHHIGWRELADETQRSALEQLP